jgi:hypothetical protein
VFRQYIAFISPSITFALHQAEEITIDKNWDLVFKAVVKVSLEHIPVTFGIVPMYIRQKGYFVLLFAK